MTSYDRMKPYVQNYAPTILHTTKFLIITGKEMIAYADQSENA